MNSWRIKDATTANVLIDLIPYRALIKRSTFNFNYLSSSLSLAFNDLWRWSISLDLKLTDLIYHLNVSPWLLPHTLEINNLLVQTHVNAYINHNQSRYIKSC